MFLPKQFRTLSSRSSRCNLSTRAEQFGVPVPQQTTFNVLAEVSISDFQVNQINANALVKNVDSVVTFLDGKAAVEVVLRTLDNVTL